MQFDIPQAKKYYSIHYLTGQNRGLSALKNIWPVVMTVDLLSIIFCPAYHIFQKFPTYM